MARLVEPSPQKRLSLPSRRAYVAALHLPEPQHLDVEVEHHLRVQGIEGDVGHPREPAFLLDPEASLRERHRVAFRIEDADGAVVNVLWLGHHHPSGVELLIARPHLAEILHLQADVVQAAPRVEFTESLPLAEQGEVVEAVGEGDVAFRRASQFLHLEVVRIEARQRVRVAAHGGHVTYSGHVLPSVGVGPVWPAEYA